MYLCTMGAFCVLEAPYAPWRGRRFYDTKAHCVSRRRLRFEGALRAMGANSTLVATVAPCIDEFVVAINTDNFAVICTFLTNHLARRKINIVDVERKRLSLRLRSICGKKSCSECPHQVSIGIDQYFFSEGFLKKVNNAHILAHATLKNDRGQNALSLTYVVQVVSSDCFAESCYNIFSCIAHLNFVYKVAFGKYGTTGGNVGRML